MPKKGLEFALNIDRDSFNEIHPHFVKLKEIIHALLQKEVFPEANRSQGKRSEQKRENKENRKQKTLKSLIHQKLGDNYVITSTDEEPFPLIIDTDENVIFENSQSEFLPKSKGQRELMHLIAHAFEISMLAPEEKRREEFYRVLLKVRGFRLVVNRYRNQHR